MTSKIACHTPNRGGPPIEVWILGGGLMGAQIGLEYALGGHTVTFITRSPNRTERRVSDATETIVAAALVRRESCAQAGERIAYAEQPPGGVDPGMIVESLPEDLDLKVQLLREAIALAGEATVASNTSSLSITELGSACGAPERTVGTHYWNPPLLMPLVELVRGRDTAESVVEDVASTLAALGKSPVLVDRDIPGFVWNRLQLALLREALWLADNGVASPETIDEIVRRGLARRWTLTGPFETAALGGVEVFQRIAENLLPRLSDAETAETLSRWVEGLDPDDLDGTRQARDEGLAAFLRSEREET